jgi:signal transduction histidine kinase
MTEDLRASRTRIVAAQDAERRRIERNLHDGAQQHLVALAVNARLARELVRSEPAEAEGLLDDVRAQADRALATLRDLARGIYPPALTDHGLIAALEAHVSVTGSNVRLEADARTCRMRFSTQVETAVYFCCLEALQNAAKYAPTAAVRVGISAADQWLQFSVVDDGPGFDSARVRGGTGLQGMADRMAALGGTLDVSACEGVGTRVVGRVPSAIPAGLLDARVP